jgi:NAD(P)-dependent dehydrogenase (short-subunit alcohol dehydrogenase family)
MVSSDQKKPEFALTAEDRARPRHLHYRLLFAPPKPINHKEVDLAGKTAIVTGANIGLGLETARHLLDLGANVILAVRDEDKGQAAQENLARGRKLRPGTIQVWKVDLSDLNSIQAFEERAKTLDRLDIVVLSAGILKATETFGPTGYEDVIQTNFLGTTLMLLLLLPIVKEKKTPGSPGRIAVVSTDWASWTKFDPKTADPILPRFKKPSPDWEPFQIYGTSKLFAMLFVQELVKRISPSDVIITLPDPGFNKSSIGREASGIVKIMLSINMLLFAYKPTVGSRTIVHAVTQFGEEAQGQYVEGDLLQP